MPTYRVIIEDDRCSDPQLVLVDVATEARAKQRAEELLRRSEHHRAVVVYEDDQLLFSMDGEWSWQPAEWREAGG